MCVCVCTQYCTVYSTVHCRGVMGFNAAPVSSGGGRAVSLLSRAKTLENAQRRILSVLRKFKLDRFIRRLMRSKDHAQFSVYSSNERCAEAKYVLLRQYAPKGRANYSAESNSFAQTQPVSSCMRHHH